MPTKRLYFLDNLKWFIIWLMTLFHAAMCYMAYAPEWWYVVDQSQPVFSATVFILWVDIFIMPVMFFISGYFGLMSLTKHGAGTFWRKKIGRIAVPWIFGSMVFAPLVTYIILASRHAPVDFWTFYTTLFWGPLYEQAQYWYLGALLALYILLTIAVAVVPSLWRQSLTPKKPSVLLYAALIALSTASIYATGSVMHPDTWSFYAYILVLQPVRIVTYILVFFLGAWAWRSRWFEMGGYTPSAWFWGLATLVLSPAYLYQKLFLAACGADAATLALANAVTQGPFMWSATLFLVAFFQRQLDYTTPLLTNLSATSYPVYYLHMEVLFPVAWLFTTLPALNVYLKYIVVCALTLGICYVLSKYILLRIPCFGGTGK